MHSERKHAHTYLVRFYHSIPFFKDQRKWHTLFSSKENRCSKSTPNGPNNQKTLHSLPASSFTSIKIKLLHVCHCTGFPGKILAQKTTLQKALFRGLLRALGASVQSCGLNKTRGISHPQPLHMARWKLPIDLS